jgi:hypothetical protein
MRNEWDSLKKTIENHVEPLLKSFGYLSKQAEDTEGGGFSLEFVLPELDRTSILFDAIKQPRPELGKKLEYVSFLRVYVGSILLKTLQDTSLETNPFLKLGWEYADDTQMITSIEEIVSALKLFLNRTLST